MGKEKDKGIGRPTKFTKAVASEICDLLCQGISLRRICALNEHLPAESTVRKWAKDDLNGFYAQYVRARDMGLDSMADEMLDIADDGENDYVERERSDGSTFVALDKEAVMRSQLRCHTRQWYLSKLAPKRYDKPTPDDKPEDEEIQEDYVLGPDEDAPEKAVL